MRLLSPALKAWLRVRHAHAASALVRVFRSFGSAELLAALRRLGVRPGDTVMVHSAFGGHHGFTGGVRELTDLFIEAVGADGNLLMVSLPYRSSALDYLQKGRRFDVRRTPSMMGLVSEEFRGRPDVVRSLNPMHPVLARGPGAAWITSGHERCVHSCGTDSPFDRLAQLDGSVLFFNVPFATFTFFHYLEHRLHRGLPFPLYAEPPFEVPVIDADGRPGSVRVFAFSRQAIERRRFAALEAELRRRGLIACQRIGNTRVERIRVRDAIACADEMHRSGRPFYDLLGPAPTAAAMADVMEARS